MFGRKTTNSFDFNLKNLRNAKISWQTVWNFNISSKASIYF